MIEAGGELGVPIAEQKLGPQRRILELPGQVRGLLTTHSPVGLAVEALEPGRFDREEVSRAHLGGVLANELLQVGPAAMRSPAG